MKRTVVMLSLTLAAGIILGVVGSHVLHAQPEPIKRTVLVNEGVHYIKNASATEPARILGCLIADKGQPMTVPVQ